MESPCLCEPTASLCRTARCCSFKMGVVKLAGHGARIVGASSVGSENLNTRTGRCGCEHNIKTDTKLTTYDNTGLVWSTVN